MVLMSTTPGFPLLLRADAAAAFLDFLWSIPESGQPSALHPSSAFDLFLQAIQWKTGTFLRGDIFCKHVEFAAQLPSYGRLEDTDT